MTASVQTQLTVEEVAGALAAQGYLADEGLATSIFLALALRRPLLLEGEAGVGKTEVAKVLAAWRGGELLRLQCYEGIDVSQAVYEWDYARQLLHLGRRRPAEPAPDEDDVYSERFLVRRPLLAAIDHAEGPPPVLLIDEVDRSDDEFEAFLLEFLSEYAVTIPELGTFRAVEPPPVIITSNRTRDVHDALKRRCLYHWVEHPDFEREVAIIRLACPRGGPGAGPPGGGRRGSPPRTASLQAARGGRVHRLGGGPGRPRPPPRSTSAAWTSPWAPCSSTRRIRPGCGPRAWTSWCALPCSAAPDARGGEVADARTDRGRVRPGPARQRAVRADRHGGAVRRGAGRWSASTTRAGCTGPGGPPWCAASEDVPVYDQVFAAYWQDRRRQRCCPPWPFDSADAGRRRRGRRGAGRQHVRRRATAPEGDVLTVRYSAVEVLRQQDLSALTPEEWVEAQRLISALGIASELRPSRRTRPSRRRARGHPDLRATVRRNMRDRGRAHPPFLAVPVERPRRLVLLLDVSGSMEPYARGLARFAHAAVHVAALGPGRGVHHGHPPHQDHPGADPPRPRRRPGRGRPVRCTTGPAGRRLGVSLQEFNDEWGIRGMARGAIVVICSDGWDRGDPALIGSEMAPPVAGGPPGGLGQPAEGFPRVRPPGPWDGGGPAVC